MNCFRIASTSSRDGPVYGRGTWSVAGSSRRVSMAVMGGVSSVREAEWRVVGFRSCLDHCLVRCGVPFDHLVAALVLARIRTANLRLEDDAVAAQSAEVVDRCPAVGGVLLEEGVEAGVEAPDDARAHRM